MYRMKAIPESYQDFLVESGILGFEIRSLAHGILNPARD